MKKQIKVVSALVLFSASGAHAQQAVQWRVEDGGNGHWYRYDAQTQSRTTAQARADAVGAYLVTITHPLEYAFLRASFPEIGSVMFWMGGFQAPGSCEPGCGWHWLSGEPWSYVNWAPGEPNNVGSEPWLGCLADGKWNDFHSGWNIKSMLEWSADCNADGIVDYGQILEGALADVNVDGIPDVCQAPCVPADLNNDRSVDGVDLGFLLSDWGPSGSEPARADINGNGFVDGLDLGVLLSNWGPCGEAPPWATVLQWQPDPAVVTDVQLRSAIAATGLPWRVRDTGTQVEMLLVPPGTFQMGCIMGSNNSRCHSHELPVHSVSLSGAFYLGRHEVTQAQWQARMGSNPSAFQSASTQVPAAQVPNRPVEQVSWNTIQGYLSATGFRLPTEAEWEYACRAGTQTPFYNGSQVESTVGTLAWYSLNSGSQTRPVGGKLANAFGFHDMLGNVWEWVSDWYGGYTSEAQTDPMGPVDASDRVIRGGSCYNGTGGVRSSDRYGVTPGLTSGNLGFRVARTP